MQAAPQARVRSWRVIIGIEVVLCVLVFGIFISRLGWVEAGAPPVSCETVETGRMTGKALGDYFYRDGTPVKYCFPATVETR